MAVAPIDIRRCRQEILASEDGTPLKNVAKYSDFFTTSECRDLLFDVQEHQLTIPQIAAFLRETAFALSASAVSRCRTIADAFRKTKPPPILSAGTY